MVTTIILSALVVCFLCNLSRGEVLQHRRPSTTMITTKNFILFFNNYSTQLHKYFQHQYI